MVRSAVVRSASLAPEDAQLADELAESVAGGSYSQLTQLLLRAVGAPLKRRVDELRASGIDPHERIFGSRVVPADTNEQMRDVYAPSSWPESGPKRP